MNANQKLQNLQYGFTVFYLLNLFVGLAVTSLLLSEGIPGVSYHFSGWLPGVSLGYGLTAGLVMLVPAWLVYSWLRQGRPWARILLLIIAWVEGAGGLFSLVFLPLIFKIPVMMRLVPSAFNEMVLAAGIVTNLLKVAFAVWFIWTVQIDPEVRRYFLLPDQTAKP